MDERKDQAQLIQELEAARRRLAELEALQFQQEQAEKAQQESLEQLKLAYRQTTIYAQELTEEIIMRRRIEQALLESEEYLRSILDNIIDAVLTMNGQGLITSCNVAAEQMFRYPTTEIIGQPIKLLIPTVDFNEQKKPGEDWVEALPNLFVERAVEGQRKDNTGFPAEITIGTFHLKDHPMYTCIIRDTTRRQQLEQQLLQAQKMEAIGRLAGGIAHDFNNLLLVVIGEADFILQEINREHPLYHSVETIRQTGTRAITLTDQLLTFSRKKVVESRVLDLNHVVVDMDKLLRRLIGEDVELETHLAPNLEPIKADPGQLEQVIVNLAVNARDAMPQGGRLIIETFSITFDEAEIMSPIGLKPGPHALLVLRDTGIGMDEQTQSHLFEPFFTTKKNGTGLGLATVYGIIQQSGGSITVDSQPGQGTTFKIWLPQVQQPLDLPRSTPILSTGQGGSETVLLVEDEVAVKTVIARCLRKKGYTVLEASHGEEALKLAAGYEDKIDLLITDMVMPGGMNGFELADYLTGQSPTLRVIYMSGYTEDIEFDARMKQPGMVFLQKPFILESLVSLVRQFLETPLGQKVIV